MAMRQTQTKKGSTRSNRGTTQYKNATGAKTRQTDSRSRRDSGNPGGGAGRREEVRGSGVYPASGPLPPDNAPHQGEASWGQGKRGAAGYQDSGSSELNLGLGRARETGRARKRSSQTRKNRK